MHKYTYVQFASLVLKSQSHNYQKSFEVITNDTGLMRSNKYCEIHKWSDMIITAYYHKPDNQSQKLTY